MIKRIDRAREIQSWILARDAEHGRWETVEAIEKDVRVRVIDPGIGWHAWTTTPFSGLPGKYPDAGNYDAAVMLKGHLAAQLPNVLDLWLGDGCKVLSVEWGWGDMKIITMRAGPWESAFGLPEREWSGVPPPGLLAAWSAISARLET